jgi:hypothetical protein
MLIFHRVYFSLMVLASLFFLLVLINNAKYMALQEVFVFQDLGYITNAIKHPRLYIPFLGAGYFLLLIGLFCGIIYLGLLIEPSVLSGMNAPIFYFVLSTSLLVVTFLLVIASCYLEEPTFNPTADLLSLGFLSSLFSYAVAEQRQNTIIDPSNRLPIRLADSRPNLLVVQSESFFDVRRLYSGVAPEVLATFDKIKTRSLSSGRVRVPAWGANTLRSEFSFLSGLALNKLGVHQFNPYRKMVNQETVTLASELRQLGYRTVCIHPYSQKFYSRHKVYPLMGFDEFIDIQQFNTKDYFGPYVGDLAVAEKISSLLSQYTEKPLFIFAITMENHGPLHLEQLNTGDEARLYQEAPPKGCDDLTLYLRHLANADKMIEVLWNKLNSLPSDAVFCWYGDHVPIMSNVYSILNTPDGATDYFLWSKQKKVNGNTLVQDIAIHELSDLIKLHMV